MNWPEALAKMTESISIGFFLVVTVWGVCKAAAAIETEKNRQESDFKKAQLEQEIWVLKNNWQEIKADEHKKILDEIHKKIVEDVTALLNKKD